MSDMKYKIIFSILIPSIPSRIEKFLIPLYEKLQKQLGERTDVEILCLLDNKKRSIAFTKKGFASIGGMCEKFFGYGSEDCEFWVRAKTLKLFKNRDCDFIHLNHKRINSYSVNGDLFFSIICNAHGRQDKYDESRF